MSRRRPRPRRHSLRRWAMGALALLCAAAWLWDVATPSPAPAQGLAAAPGASSTPTGSDSGLVARGRALFVAGCASCHGLDARGNPRMGPNLVGVGARAADFYLSTGRMPLNVPSDEPVRNKPQYTHAQIRALTAYVGSLGGPGIPAVAPARGSLSEGLNDFTLHCAGCHQVIARGGIVTPATIAPDLGSVNAREVAEAVRIGPFEMPRFSTHQIDQRQLNSLARYVLYAAQHPVNAGGWGIGNIGPIPEGMVAWFLAIVALVIVARLIGEREPSA